MSEQLTELPELCASPAVHAASKSHRQHELLGVVPRDGPSSLLAEELRDLLQAMLPVVTIVLDMFWELRHE